MDAAHPYLLVLRSNLFFPDIDSDTSTQVLQSNTSAIFSTNLSHEY